MSSLAAAAAAPGDGLEGSSDEEDLTHFSLGTLDLTTEGDIDFNEIDADLKRFQEDAMVQASLSRGVDLRQYARETERDLRALAKDSITDYMERVEDVARLNEEIDVCDKTLERMQQMLQTFQSRLGGISDDIKHLQDDSLSMNVKLRNRRAVEARLQTFLEGVVVPPQLVVGICDNEVNEAFVSDLTTLNKKLKYVSSGDQPQRLKDHDYTPEMVSRKRRSSKGTGAGQGGASASAGGGASGEVFTLGVAPRDTESVREVIPVLEMLRTKAVAKVRDFLLSRITALRKGKTNVQMTQKMLLKFRYLYQFLVEHAASVAEEVRNVYLSAMSKVLLALFKSYHSQLGKITLRRDDKRSLLAVLPYTGRSNKAFGVRMAVAGGSSKAQGRRGSSSKNDNGPDGSGTAGALNEDVVADPVLGVFALNRRDEILDDLDTPPIVMHIAQKEGQKFSYEHVFRSVQKHLIDSAANDFTFLVDFFGTRSHDLFNTIYSKTLSLCLENLEHFLSTTLDSVALLLLIRINQHLRKTMQRRCCPCLDPYLDRVDLLLWPRIKVVLDKNIASLTSSSPGKLGPLEFHADDRDTFLSLLEEQKQLFVEEELSESFGRLLEFVPKAEAQLGIQTDGGDGDGDDNGAADSDAAASTTQQTKEEIAAAAESVDKSKIESLVRHFGSTWKAGISHMAKSINTYFQDLKNGMSILKLCLTQLLLYHTRFQEIIDRVFKNKPVPFAKERVPIQSLFFEIRKYSQ
eukprot:g2529.t1